MKRFFNSGMGIFKMLVSMMVVTVLAVCLTSTAYADRDDRRGNSWRGDDRRIERGVDRKIKRGDDRHIKTSKKYKKRHKQFVPKRRSYKRHFNQRNTAIWRGGKWHYRRYNGQLGWWWAVGGLSYLYTQPVYPYPDRYLAPTVVTRPAPSYSPPAATVAPAVASQSWYYCESSDSYYPYVSTCSEGWQTVPATPPSPN